MERELLKERMDGLAIVLDQVMPRCAELVRYAITVLNELEEICYDMKHNTECSDCIPDSIDDCFECRKDREVGYKK